MAKDNVEEIRATILKMVAAMENELVTKARLDLHDGRIHYRLYQQDGTMQAMDCADTPSNRLCVSWFQAHDRYTTGSNVEDSK